MFHLLFLIFILSQQSIYSQNSEEKVDKPPISQEKNEQEQLKKWSETMLYGVSDERLHIVKKIRSEKISDALPLLARSFSEDKNQYVKEEIIFTFIDMNYKNNNQFWKDIFVNESNLVVLQRTAFAVEKLEIPVGAELYQKLSDLLSTPQAMRFKASAVQALGKIKYTESIPVITEIATNMTNHQDLRGSAVVGLGMFQDASMIPLLQNFLTNSSESQLIRRYAALAIGRTENPEAIKILSPIAVDEEEEQSVRINSISGLGYLKNNPELETIMQTLTKSDNTSIRNEAVESLGKMQAKNSQKILEYKALNDPEAIVRRSAKTALQSLGVDISELGEKK